MHIENCHNQSAESRNLVLSPHVRKHTQREGPVLVHGLSGSKAASTPDLDAFLDSLVSKEGQDRTVSHTFRSSDLPSVSDLRRMDFLVSPDADEEEQWIEDLDLLKNYSCTASEHFRIYYGSTSDQMARGYSSCLAYAYSDLKARLPFRLRKKATAVLCASRKHFSAIWGKHHLPDWVKAFATMGCILVFDCREIDMRNTRSSATTTNIMHELVHLALFRNYIRVPLWMEEGLCEYYSRPYSDSGFRRLLKHKHVFGLQELEALPRNSLLDLDDSPGIENICYRQSHSIVAYMMNVWGEDRVIRCLNGTDLSQGIRDAIRKICSEDLDTLEERWKAEYGCRDTVKLAFAGDLQCTREKDKIVLASHHTGGSVTANPEINELMHFMKGGKTLKEISEDYDVVGLEREMRILYGNGIVVWG